MKCSFCGGNKTYIKEYEHNYVFKDKKVSFVSKRKFCSDCNNLVYDSELDNEAGNKAIELYNKLYGIEKEKIISLRKKYKLSQDLFAKIIGCARKTLISYEKGTAIPNDNYIIIINSLIENPETIEVLINANKNHFSDKEYNEIEKKINSYFGNNTKQLFNSEEFKLTEYNGYTKLDKEKVINMILYFSDGVTLKTKMLKEMFYADFVNYKNTGMSITGLEYAKIPLGPVPDEFEKILNEFEKEKLISYNVKYKGDYECHNIKALKKFNEKVFDEEELLILKKIKDYFKNYGSRDIVDFSHEEKAFTETDFFKKISYDYAFDIEKL